MTKREYDEMRFKDFFLRNPKNFMDVVIYGPESYVVTIHVPEFFSNTVCHSTSMEEGIRGALDLHYKRLELLVHVVPRKETSNEQTR